MNSKTGVLVSVPPKVPHKVYDVTEDMEIYDVFSDCHRMRLSVGDRKV